MTRSFLRPMVAILAGLAFPAWAGTDSSETPNPFTDPPNPSTALSSADKAGGATATPAVLPPAGELVPRDTATTNPSPPPDDSFYQAAKKDTGGR